MEEEASEAKGMPEPIIPIVKRKTPILDMLREKGLLSQRVGTTPETLTEAQKRLAEEFRRGIASAIGVPPEAIREDLVEKWVIEWSKALTKPEYWAEGYKLGEILGQALPPRGAGLVTGRAGERRGGRPRTEEERRERHFGSGEKPESESQGLEISIG